MKRVITLLLLSISFFYARAQEGKQNPDFFRVTFWGDARTYWAEDITALPIPKTNPIRTLRFCHSNSIYTIDKNNGNILNSTGVYKKGEIQSLQLLSQGISNEVNSISIYQFEDGKKFPGLLEDATTDNNSVIIKLQFLHSGSNYEFIEVANSNIFYVTKSNGSYKNGDKVIQISYALQDLKTYTK